MFFIIKFFIILLFLVAVFFVPLGSRPLSGHVKAIWATPESRELKKELLTNMLMLDEWMKTHQALSGETVPPEKAGAPLPGSTTDMRAAAPPAPPRVAPAPVEPPVEPPVAMRRRSPRTGSRTKRGETP